MQAISPKAYGPHRLHALAQGTAPLGSFAASSRAAHADDAKTRGRTPPAGVAPASSTAEEAPAAAAATATDEARSVPLVSSAAVSISTRILG